MYRVRILKMRYATLGMAIEGGANTQQSWPRIIAIRPEGAAFQTGGECLREGPWKIAQLFYLLYQYVPMYQ